jgi:RND family efflux transporter MFP subunit
MTARDKQARAAGAVAALAVGLCAVAGGCGSGAGKASAAREPSPAAAVVKVTRGDMAERFSTAAVFRPYQEIQIYAKVPGYVRQINVDIGDRVKKGELLATLDVPELVAAVQHAEAAVARDQEEQRRAESDVERAKSAYNVAHLDYTRLAAVAKQRPGLVAQQEVDDAEGKDLETQAGVSTAQASVAAAQQQLAVDRAELEKEKSMEDYSRITAPFDGVVTDRYADTGAMLAAGTSTEKNALPLVQLAQNGLLRLDIPVPESVVPSVREGQPVAVEVQSLHKTFQGTVRRFTRQLDLSTRTMETEIDVPNPNLELVPGMYGTASLGLQTAHNVLLLPAEAVVLGEESPYVLVVDSSGHIQRRQVTLGIQGANRDEITGGVREGEMVVAAGQGQYHEGERVSPQPAMLPPAPAAPEGNQ